MEKGAFWSPSTTVANFTYFTDHYYVIPWEFFTLALPDGLSLELEWHQVFSNLQDSSYIIIIIIWFLCLLGHLSFLLSLHINP